MNRRLVIPIALGIVAIIAMAGLPFLQKIGWGWEESGATEFPTSAPKAPASPTINPPAISANTTPTSSSADLSGNQVVRTATKVVAASNSSAASKAQADYVADGTADNVEIQAAIDALPAGGGKVVLSEGTYYLNNSINIVTGKDNITIEGNGAVLTILSSPSENLTADSGTDTTLEVANSSSFAVGMGVWIRDNNLYMNETDLRTITSIPNSTTIVVNSSFSRNWLTADGAKIVSLFRYINVEDVTEANPVKNFTVRGITFDGNSSVVSVKGSWHVPMLNLYNTSGTIVSGNTFKNGNTNAITDGGSEVIIIGNVFQDFKAKDSVNGFEVIHFGNTGRKVFSNNLMYDIASRFGVYQSMGTEELVISNNVIQVTASPEAAIQINSITDDRTLLIGNNIESTGTDPILIQDLGTDTLIIGNILRGGVVSILYEGAGGYIANNRMFSANRAIQVGNVSSGTIMGNTFSSNAKDIRLNNTSNMVVINNIMEIKIEFIGTNTGYIIRGNTGHVTENSGTATVIAGQTTANVTHKLATTPTRVQLTPTADTAGKRYWVSAKGDTTFTISIDSAHSDNIAFDWKAQVGEW